MGTGFARGLLAAGTGALEGTIKGYSYEQQQQLERQKLAQAQDLAELRLEVQQMIAQMNEGGRNARHDTASGDTLARESGANTRADASNQTRVDVANIGAGSRERVASSNNDARLTGIDRQVAGAFDRAQLAEGGRNTRWATPSGNATLQSQTTRRGQDIRSADSRFGVTTRDTTDRRGQDMSSGDRRYAADARTRLFDGIFNGSGGSGGTPVTVNGVRPSQFPPPGMPPAVTDVQVEPQSMPPGDPQAGPPPAATPVPPPPPISSTPVTPRPQPGVMPGPARPARPTPPGGAAGGVNQALTVLTQQATATLQAYQAERDPAKRAQLQRQLLELKRRKDTLAAAGGGQ